MKGRISVFKESKDTCEPVFSITTVVDRVLKKHTRIADDHGKKLPEASVSLK
jgi:hypothetical protein